VRLTVWGADKLVKVLGSEDYVGICAALKNT